MRRTWQAVAASLRRRPRAADRRFADSALGAGAPGDHAARREDLERELAIVYAAAPVGLGLFDRELRCLRANGALGDLHGMPAAALIGRTLPEIDAGPARELAATCRRVLETGVPAVSIAVARSAGADTATARHWRVDVHPVRGREGQVAGVAGIAAETTAQLQAQARIARLAQLKDALSAANRALIRSTDEQALARDICEIIARRTAIVFAAVGEVDEATGAVVPRAAAGPIPEALLRELVVSARGDVPEGRGPTGVAIREGRTVICADFQGDPATRPWHELAARLGVRSSAAFPLWRGGRVHGAIDVFAGEPDAFGDEIVALLEEFAADVSFALDNFSREAERARAEAALRESEARFRSLIDLSSDWYWEQDADYRFTAMAGQLPERTGIGSTEHLRRARWELPALNMTVEDWARHKADLDARLPFRNLEIRRPDANGRMHWVSISGEPVFDAAGAFRGYRGVGTDITERKHEERMLALEHRVAGCLARSSPAGAAMEEVIRIVCETQGWHYGMHCRTDDDAGVLHVCDFWGAPGHASREFFDKVRPLATPLGAGVSGRAWATAEPIWIADARTDARLLRRDLVLAAGWRGLFAVPLIADGHVVGVLIFFNQEVCEPDKRLLSAAGAIGRQVGQFLLRRRAEDQFRFQSLLLATVGDAVIASDTDGRITYMNAAAERIYGWRAGEALGRDVFETVRSADDRAEGLAARREVERGSVWRGEVVGRRRDGTTFPARLALAPVRDAGGAITGLVGVSNDITELKQAERSIREKVRQQGLIATFSQSALGAAGVEELFEHAVRAVGEGLGVDGCVVLELVPDDGSLALRAGTGIDEEWMAPEVGSIAPGTQNRYALDAGAAVMVDDYAHERRFAVPGVVARSGMRSAVHVLVGGVEGRYGLLGAYARAPGRFAPEHVDFLQSIANTLATAVDRRVTAGRFAYQAQFDTVTGLPTRNLFRDRLALTLTQAGRSGSSVAVAVIDLDRFRIINDSYGHDAGDQLLVLIAQRLRDRVRSGDTLGRLDGGRFASVLSNLATADEANLVVQEVADAFARPFALCGRDVRLTASVGIAIYPGDGEDGDALLANADAAMHRAKALGRNTFQFYTEALTAQVARRIEVERELRDAIERREFVLHYQPQIALDTGRIVGFEALVRWRHPERGLLPPGEFIGVAEQTGLIVPIGQWVVETACGQAAEWHRRGHPDLFVAVNLSPLELRRNDAAEHIVAALARSGLDPRFLEIEVTETMGVDDAEAFARVLDALKAIGVTVAIDDFGTGYSILSHLKRFPIDTVKIDRAFIRDLASDGDDAAIVQAIIAMSHELQLAVTAEGVETEEQAGMLRRLRCNHAQGYLFGRPMPAAQVGELLDSRNESQPGAPARRLPRSLLLVDGDPGSQWALRTVLARDGYDIHSAATAGQALQLLAAHPFAVVVADQRLPGASGAEFLAEVARSQPDIARIAVSGFADMVEVTTAIARGAVDRLVLKPWENGELSDNVRQAFRQHGERVAARASPRPGG